ncbi:unnamed protein product [Vitrella brassicaformis CCMP3155]|uniref:Uncharacterized protein n=1 Tax=Vitrella brassicaformis (strain CCMP3155) TaxID=1169540 RepID=A0A0G4GMF2_VITBC|nr:unnamed protein product [Vitrella brassicaformis CCMP3155]|eukprot:CEM31374.1 unnamed protein product [Vitrella brassicaformis CCMP3155]
MSFMCRESACEGLERQAASKDRHIKTLERRVSELSSEVHCHTHDPVLLEKIHTLEVEVSAKQEYIDQLEQTAKKGNVLLWEKATNLEKECQAKATYIDQVEQALDVTSRDTDSLRKHIEELQLMIERYRHAHPSLGGTEVPALPPPASGTASGFRSLPPSLPLSRDRARSSDAIARKSRIPVGYGSQKGSPTMGSTLRPRDDVEEGGSVTRVEVGHDEAGYTRIQVDARVSSNSSTSSPHHSSSRPASPPPPMPTTDTKSLLFQNLTTMSRHRTKGTDALPAHEPRLASPAVLRDAPFNTRIGGSERPKSSHAVGSPPKPLDGTKLPEGSLSFTPSKECVTSSGGRAEGNGLPGGRSNDRVSSFSSPTWDDGNRGRDLDGRAGGRGSPLDAASCRKEVTDKIARIREVMERTEERSPTRHSPVHPSLPVPRVASPPNVQRGKQRSNEGKM